MLVQARDPDGNALSDEQFIAHTNILLVAGHETSTSMSAWLLYLLAQHPDYLGACRRSRPRSSRMVRTRRSICIQRMKVLENALMEAERLYPPVPYGPRGVVEDFDFHGYHVPADRTSSTPSPPRISSRASSRTPTTFDPDRFAPPREEQKKTPYALVGFGGGPRICIGINFAKVEIKAMIAEILRRYTLELSPDQDVELFGVISRPRYGVRMHVHARERIPAAV